MSADLLGLLAPEPVDMAEDDALEYIHKKYGPPMVVASEIVRPTFMASAGHWLARGDYSQVEARMNNWFSGQDWVLQAFRDLDAGTGPDLYKVTAAGILTILRGPTSVEEVTKEERQTFGKVPELACIAEDQLVLTDAGLVPIQHVTAAMRVWDGIEFVNHKGAIYKGVQECIDYDGLIATPTHILFVASSPGEVNFGDAAGRCLPLQRAGLAGPDGWLCEDRERHDNTNSSSEGLRHRGFGEVSDLCVTAGVEALAPDKARGELGVRIVCPERDADLSLAPQTPVRRESSLREPEKSSVVALRRPGGDVRLLIGSPRGGVVHGQCADAEDSYQASGVGPDGQQPRLRPGESTTGDYARQPEQPREHSVRGLRRHEGTEDGCPSRVQISLPESGLRGPHSAAVLRAGDDAGGRGQSSGNYKSMQTYRPVWDILEAGPRNRFTVSGRLVHNCGFQGSVGAFQAMARVYQVKIPDEDAIKIVHAFRERNPLIKKFWGDMQKAATACIEGPTGVKHEVRPGLWFIRGHAAMMMRKPSGRALTYWRPHLREVDTPYGPRKAVWYWGENTKTHRWEPCATYGGNLVNNAVQSTARDIMADALLRLDADNMRPVLTVHDEAVCEVPWTRFPEAAAAAARVGEIMAVVPEWAPGLPLAVDVSAGRRYVKA